MDSFVKPSRILSREEVRANHRVPGMMQASHPERPTTPRCDVLKESLAVPRSRVARLPRAGHDARRAHPRTAPRGADHEGG